MVASLRRHCHPSNDTRNFLNGNKNDTSLDNFLAVLVVGVRRRRRPVLGAEWPHPSCPQDMEWMGMKVWDRNLLAVVPQVQLAVDLPHPVRIPRGEIAHLHMSIVLVNYNYFLHVFFVVVALDKRL